MSEVLKAARALVALSESERELAIGFARELAGVQPVVSAKAGNGKVVIRRAKRVRLAASSTPPASPIGKRRGRPKGSKNKPKAATTSGSVKLAGAVAMAEPPEEEVATE